MASLPDLRSAADQQQQQQPATQRLDGGDEDAAKPIETACALADNKGDVFERESPAQQAFQALSSAAVTD